MHTIMNFIISIHNTVSKRVPFQVRFALDDGDDCAHFTVIIIIIPALNLQYPVTNLKSFVNKNNRQRILPVRCLIYQSQSQKQLLNFANANILQASLLTVNYSAMARMRWSIKGNY